MSASELSTRIGLNGEYETVTWRQLGRISPCPRDGQSRVLSGPLWLGALHDRQYLHRMQISAQQHGWSSRVKLLQTMIAEADLPTPREGSRCNF